DIFGLRLIVENAADRDRVLGLLLEYFGAAEPKDFEEKWGKYHAYHINLKDAQGRCIEIQIFWDRQEYNRYAIGEAAHWVKKAKEENPGKKFFFDPVEVQNGNFFEDFLAIYNSGDIKDYVYVLWAQNGHALRLRKQATAADFAALPRINRFSQNFKGVLEMQEEISFMSALESSDEEEQAMLTHQSAIPLSGSRPTERKATEAITPGCTIVSVQEKENYLIERNQGELRSGEIRGSAKHPRTLMVLALSSYNGKNKPGYQESLVREGSQILSEILGIKINRELPMREFISPLIYKYDLFWAEELYTCMALAKRGNKAIEERLFDLTLIKQQAQAQGEAIWKKTKITLPEETILMTLEFTSMKQLFIALATGQITVQEIVRVKAEGDSVKGKLNENYSNKDAARSKSGLSLTPEEVAAEITGKNNKLRFLDAAEFVQLDLAAELVRKFVSAKGNSYWIPKLEEMLADQGKLRAGPFSLFYGTFFEGELYFDAPFLKSPLSVALTILHELGALMGLPHEQNIKLESEFISYLSAENLSPVELITVMTEKGLVGIECGRFPDGEWNPLILNPYLLGSADATIRYHIKNCHDMVKLMLVMGNLRLNKAQHINFVLERDGQVTNGLDAIFLCVCDELFYSNGLAAGNFPVSLPPMATKKELGVWVHRVLYQHARFQPDAEEAAKIINAHAEKIEIDKTEEDPLSWGIILPEGLEGQNVVLVHSTENDLDWVELWLMILALRRAGVGSDFLFNAYAGYSRQDKIFRSGEGVSASIMLGIVSTLTDLSFVPNIHYGGKSGFAGLNGYSFKLYNLNAFVQLAEKLFDSIVAQVDALTIISKLIKTQAKKPFGRLGSWV
ncbi:MAG: ribose-phosphate pyrophosphokinase-like domain-containing protein, partial [Candidatus Omnitrophota bacterium]